MMMGTDGHSTTGWGAGGAIATANQFNLMGTVGNNFELFDVSLTEGTVAPPFVVPDYASELALCKRYWRLSPDAAGHWYEVNANASFFAFSLDPEMRILPTVTPLIGQVSRPGIGNVAMNSVGSVSGSTRGIFVSILTAASVAGVPALLPSGSLSFNARL